MVIQSDLNVELGPWYQNNNTLNNNRIYHFNSTLIVSEINKIEYRYEIIIKFILS